jgi:hypothetical protein
VLEAARESAEGVVDDVLNVASGLDDAEVLGDVLAVEVLVAELGVYVELVSVFDVGLVEAVVFKLPLVVSVVVLGLRYVESVLTEAVAPVEVLVE